MSAASWSWVDVAAPVAGDGGDGGRGAGHVVLPHEAHRQVDAASVAGGGGEARGDVGVVAGLLVGGGEGGGAGLLVAAEAVQRVGAARVRPEQAVAGREGEAAFREIEGGEDVLVAAGFLQRVGQVQGEVAGLGVGHGFVQQGEGFLVAVAEAQEVGAVADGPAPEGMATERLGAEGERLVVAVLGAEQVAVLLHQPAALGEGAAGAVDEGFGRGEVAEVGQRAGAEREEVGLGGVGGRAVGRVGPMRVEPVQQFVGAVAPEAVEGVVVGGLRVPQGDAVGAEDELTAEEPGAGHVYDARGLDERGGVFPGVPGLRLVGAQEGQRVEHPFLVDQSLDALDVDACMPGQARRDGAGRKGEFPGRGVELARGEAGDNHPQSVFSDFQREDAKGREEQTKFGDLRLVRSVTCAS